MDTERMRSDHWLGSVLCIFFSALTLMIGSQEGHPTLERPVPFVAKGSVPEHAWEES